MRRHEPHLQLVSAAFLRLCPLHPRVRNEHADSLVARAEGAARLAGASSVSQPLSRAATTFESVAAVNQTANEVQTMANIATVSFHDQSIIAIEHEGKHFVALRPIVENIGLDWAAQYTRINRHHVLKSTVAVMTTVAEDGKQREMLCLPLSMLNGWLFGVDVNRVREEIRPKLIRYQTECFDVLYRHFTPAQRPYNPAIDYTRISPAQAQDLKELVHAIVDGKIQGYGETWARLHRKFRVNSYLELPASRFEEARDYLLGKLPETAQQPEPLPSVFMQSLAAARESAMAYLDGYRQAVQSGQPGPRIDEIPQHLLEGIVAEALMSNRFLASFDMRTGQMCAQLVPKDASVFSFQNGDFGQAISAIPTRRLPELQDALSRRVARHLGVLQN